MADHYAQINKLIASLQGAGFGTSKDFADLAKSWDGMSTMDKSDSLRAWLGKQYPSTYYAENPYENQQDFGDDLQAERKATQDAQAKYLASPEYARMVKEHDVYYATPEGKQRAAYEGLQQTLKDEALAEIDRKQDNSAGWVGQRVGDLMDNVWDKYNNQISAAILATIAGGAGSALAGAGELGAGASGIGTTGAGSLGTIDTLGASSIGSGLSVPSLADLGVSSVAPGLTGAAADVAATAGIPTAAAGAAPAALSTPWYAPITNPAGSLGITNPIGSSAINGAARGAITSGITGNDIGKGALLGGIAGGIGGTFGAGQGQYNFGKDIGLSGSAANVANSGIAGVTNAAVQGGNVQNALLNGIVNTGVTSFNPAGYLGVDDKALAGGINNATSGLIKTGITGGDLGQSLINSGINTGVNYYDPAGQLGLDPNLGKAFNQTVGGALKGQNVLTPMTAFNLGLGAFNDYTNTGKVADIPANDISKITAPNLSDQFTPLQNYDLKLPTGPNMDDDTDWESYFNNLIASSPKEGTGGGMSIDDWINSAADQPVTATVDPETGMNTLPTVAVTGKSRDDTVPTFDYTPITTDVSSGPLNPMPAPLVSGGDSSSGSGINIGNALGGLGSLLTSGKGLASVLAALTAYQQAKKPPTVIGGGYTSGPKGTTVTRTMDQGRYGPIARYHYASGGIADLQEKEVQLKPRYVKGPGDGMSDSINANIDGKHPAKIASGEFIVPADVVSHLGNGSSDAGAERLHDMMAKIRQARTGSSKQAPKIAPNKFLK